MVRKFFLVASTVWLARSANYQIYVGVWVLLTSFMLQAVFKPYADERVGFLETLSLGATLTSLLLGLAIALGDLSAFQITIVRCLVACINVMMLFTFMRFGFFDLRESREVADMLANTTNPMLSPSAPSSGGTDSGGRRRSGWIRTRASQAFQNNPALEISDDDDGVTQPQPAAEQGIQTRNEPSRSRV